MPDQPASSSLLTELQTALKIVDLEYGRDTPKSPPASLLGNIQPFGALFPFAEQERRQLESVRDLILRFVNQGSQKHPLCLAVFGPPGSGKSFAVEQIIKQVVVQNEASRDVKLPFFRVNMTQIASPTELTQTLARVAGEQDEKSVPVVFFDEFDTKYQGAAFGWLGWFLAPMHDGEFWHEGAKIRLRRAVYVFAGGTAATLGEFSNPRDRTSFRAAKGPDFISRLRGFVDVPGPNHAEQRLLRRALILRSEIADRVGRHGKGAFKVAPEVLESLLQVGRYRHGARSIAALIELMELASPSLDWSIFPAEHLLQLHIDRGPLDAKELGGSIAFSGYQSPKQAGAEVTRPKPPEQADKPERPEDTWLAVAEALWRNGATLAFAGGFDRKTEGRGETLMELLVQKLRAYPMEPSRSGPAYRPRPRLVSYPQQNMMSNADLYIDGNERERIGLEIKKVTELDLSTLGLSDGLKRVVRRFWRRLKVAEDSVARFAIGGATDAKSIGGRFPGVAEEIMLTLALGKPIYLSGGFGGASAELGPLLGLSEPSSGAPPASLEMSRFDPGQVAELAKASHLLRPPPLLDLPLGPEELVRFLQTRALGSAGWPENGLTFQENRQLFRATSPTEVTALVLLGLTRRFGPDPGA